MTNEHACRAVMEQPEMPELACTFWLTRPITLIYEKFSTFIVTKLPI
jgi:hypothetical protein